jgi:cephalosporin hydroxylase
MTRFEGFFAVVVALFAGIGIHQAYAKHNIQRDFHRWLYDRNDWLGKTRWLGVATEKNPMDMWVYQDIVYETKPDVLIEAGTAFGGSAYYFASMFDLLGKGRVITIDIVENASRPKHPRITYLLGSSTSDDILRQVREGIHPGERVMVVLDSDHSAEHVKRELEDYSPLVSQGCYLVVEDTNINGNPVRPDFGPGPNEAVHDFLGSHKNFAPDFSREYFGVTYFPGGWLRKQ